MRRRPRGTRAVLPVLLLAACSQAPAPVPVAGPTSTTAPAPAPPEPDTATLLATGDVLVHQDGALVAGATRDDGGFDFSTVLAPVAGIVGAADLAVCHLETPVAPPGGPYRGYPSFAVQPEVVDALAGAGYDLCTTASNHALDDGFAGLARTLDLLDAAGLAHAGTARSEEESTTPVLLEAGGIRFASVAGTFGTNGVPLPPGREWAVDVVDAPDVTGMLADAARARAAGAEVVVASLHCCAEYRHDPSEAQVAAVRALLASPDVDLVLGHHAHVVQPAERIDGEWAVYGLGNHVAEHATRGHATEDSVAARFTFTRGPDGRVGVTRAEAVPLRIDRRPDAVQVVPADPATAARVAEVLDRRGARAAGLEIVAG